MTVTATLTEYGSKITGYPVGSVFSWEEAKDLPSGDVANGLFVANWNFTKDDLEDIQ